MIKISAKAGLIIMSIITAFLCAQLSIFLFSLILGESHEDYLRLLLLRNEVTPFAMISAGVATAFYSKMFADNAAENHSNGLFGTLGIVGFSYFIYYFLVLIFLFVTDYRSIAYVSNQAAAFLFGTVILSAVPAVLMGWPTCRWALEKRRIELSQEWP